MGDLVLIALVLGVAAGLVTTAVSAERVHSRQTAFSRRFLANILLFNLLVLMGLILRHTLSQPPGPHAALRRGLLVGLLAVMAILKVGWVVVFEAMNRTLLGREIPREWRPWIAAVAGSLVLFYAALLVVAVAGESVILLEVTVPLFELLVIGAAIASACRLALAAAFPAADRRRPVVTFGVLHALLLAAVFGSVVLGWLRAADHTLFNALLLIAYNLLPLAWISRFQPEGPEALRGDANRYGITAREREIIELIGAGRTNQEIADRLFISLATVKDHNHNIFRKTGVRSRLELANLFRDRR